jgi:hypothetical protein
LKNKDPRKVAAGKQRAKTALRNSKGQLVSKSFKDEVQKIAVSSAYTGKDLQRFYEQNAAEIDPYLEKNIRSQNRYAIKTIEKVVKTTSKDVWIQDEHGSTYKTTPEQIAFKMATFEQYCYTERNCTGVVWKKERTGTGEPIVRLPEDFNREDMEDMEDMEFIEYCAEFGVIVFISDLSKIKDKAKREKRERWKQNKLNNAKAIKRTNRVKTAGKRKRRT